MFTMFLVVGGCFVILWERRRRESGKKGYGDRPLGFSNVSKILQCQSSLNLGY